MDTVAQQDWLKQRVEMIWKDTDDMLLGMDGLYRVEDSEESHQVFGVGTVGVDRFDKHL